MQHDVLAQDAPGIALDQAGQGQRMRPGKGEVYIALGSRLLAVLSRDHLTEDDWEELEETLLLADVGAGPSADLIEALRTRVRVDGLKDPAQVRAPLREAWKVWLGPIAREEEPTGEVHEDRTDERAGG